MSTFNAFQYDDLAAKGHDLYAATKYEILLGHLRGAGRLRVLNAGCGSGELSLLIASRGHSVVGIDPEPAYIGLARKNLAAARGVDCRFEVGAIEDYPGPGSFDCAVCTDVLEHIADDRAAFSKLAGLVRPGGTVLITVPGGPWLFGYHDEQLGHFRRYTKRTLRRLVEPECDVAALRYFGASLIPVCLAYSKWLRRPYPVAESGDPGKSPLKSRVLKGLLALDRRLPLPLGTSLVLKAVRRQAAPAAEVVRAAA